MSSKDHDALSAKQVAAIGLPDEEPTFLGDPMHDKLVNAIIALGGELWVERERRQQLESLLVSNGVITRETLTSHALTTEEKTACDVSLSGIVERVLGALKPAMQAPPAQ